MKVRNKLHKMRNKESYLKKKEKNVCATLLKMDDTFNFFMNCAAHSRCSREKVRSLNKIETFEMAHYRQFCSHCLIN